MHLHTHTLDFITTQICSTSKIFYSYLPVSINSLSFQSRSTEGHTKLCNVSTTSFITDLSALFWTHFPVLFNLGPAPRSLSSTTLLIALFSSHHTNLLKSLIPRASYVLIIQVSAAEKYLIGKMYATQNSWFLAQLDLRSLLGSLLSITK